jgi:hypothetical protein
VEAWSFSAGLGAVLRHFCHSASCLFFEVNRFETVVISISWPIYLAMRGTGAVMRDFSRISEGFRSKDSAANQFIGGRARQLASETQDAIKRVDQAFTRDINKTVFLLPV